MELLVAAQSFMFQMFKLAGTLFMECWPTALLKRREVAAGEFELVLVQTVWMAWNRS